MLLPPEMKGFFVGSKTPEACLKVAKQITIAAYDGARKLLGDTRAVVCIPPKELLQDPEIQARMLWKGMAVIRPWDAIPEAVLAIEPHILDDTSIRNGELDVEQKEVLQEIQALVEVAEFMHYWSRKGCTLELETEYEP
ncbi:hypothetical protein CVIRNUC_001224 [Coccomyxa viridis]|uniref:Uncharacterized protein n=1 Tax=Coccomyxa viridis TaxID=1274662 RepID=A0AAV1HVX2_9CHLO|nr:hypothetical protein CVIRNUC_001224 [Coccomyxa viridis]